MVPLEPWTNTLILSTSIAASTQQITQNQLKHRAAAKLSLTSTYFQKHTHACMHAAAQPSQEMLRVNTSPGRHWAQNTMSPPACLPQQVIWNLRGVKPQSGGGAAATSAHAVTGMKLTCATQWHLIT